MEKDLIVKYVNGAMTNLRRLSGHLNVAAEIPLQSREVHGNVETVSISSSDARFLSDYLLQVANEALRLSDKLLSLTTDEA